MAGWRVRWLAVTSDPDTLPHHDDPTGPCPSCGRVSSFFLPAQYDIGGGHNVCVLTCQGCRLSTVVIEKYAVEGERTVFEPVHWWPVPGAGRLDPDVDPRVAGAYDEGMRCLAVQAPRAAAVMFRAMLAFVVSDKGSPEAKNKRGLKARLKQMADDHTLHPSLAAWAENIRVLGDSGAHPDELPEPTQAEAEDLGRLCRRLIEFVYEINARISRSRPATTAT